MLSTYLDNNKIIVDLDATNYHQALEILIQKSSEKDNKALLEAIFKREKLMKTTLGKGMAFPRVHVANKDSSEIMVGISKNAIDARGFDLINIRIIVLFIFSSQDDHAAILAECLHLLNDNSMRAELLQVSNGEEFIARVREWERSE